MQSFQRIGALKTRLLRRGQGWYGGGVISMRFFHALGLSVLLAAVGTYADLLDGFRRGANFGNYLEAPRGQDWGADYTEADLEAMVREGFDHVRIPVRWNDYTEEGPAFRIEEELYGKVDFLVTNALARGLSVLVNIHHFDEFTTDPEGQKEKFLAIWKQLSEHYADFPKELAFELLNEPKDAATTEVMNGIYAEAIKVIREENPERRIFVGPGRWNSLDEVENLKLPEADRNLVVTVHSYEPFLFTHQGASWTMPDTATTGIIYPGPPKEPIEPDPRADKDWIRDWIRDYNRLPKEENPSSRKAFAGRMKKAAEWGKAHGRPIHLGEFGAYVKADPASRNRFYEEVRKTAEGLGLGWCIWDWKAGFRYWDEGKPVPGMRRALFGARAD